MENILILSDDGKTIKGINDNVVHLIIPEGVTNIGGKAFENCISLQSIDIPNSVKSIGWYAFAGCTSLQSIEIPYGVTSINNGAFRGCTSLQSIEIPNGMTKIGVGVFAGCTSLQSIEIPQSVTYIVGAFRGCTSLKSIDIPNSVTKIDGPAFRNCTSLQNIDIPNSVIEIGKSAFQGCTSLNSIIIPNSITKIGDFAFSETGLIKIGIPASVVFIGKHAFCNSPISEFIVEENNLHFISIDGVLLSYAGFTDKGKDIYILQKYPPKKSQHKYIIEANIHQLDCCAFKGAQNLEEIILHDNISNFGDEQTFALCTSLKEIRIPPKIKRLPPSCFAGCIALENVYICDREKLQIEKKTFEGCSSIKGLHFRIYKPENIAVAANAFDEETFDNCVLFVPSGTRWAYRHHPILGKFKNIEIEK